MPCNLIVSPRACGERVKRSSQARGETALVLLIRPAEKLIPDAAPRERKETIVPHEPGSRRRRELFLVLLLTISAACFLAVYFLMVSGPLFLALLIVTAAIALGGCLHYLIWGRSIQKRG